MKIAFNLIALLLMSLSSVQANSDATEQWLSNIGEAVKKAEASNKFVLIKFTSSDNSPPCKKINGSVFEKQEFIEGAYKNFILCVIDTPKNDKKITTQNRPILKKFLIQKLPTVVLIDTIGKEFTRFSPIAYDTPAKMLEQLSYQLRRKEMF